MIYLPLEWLLVIIIIIYYYQVYQLGTGRLTQKAQACNRLMDKCPNKALNPTLMETKYRLLFMD